MSKKKILLIAVAFVIAAVGIVAASVSQKQKKMDPQELLQRFEKAAEEVFLCPVGRGGIPSGLPCELPGGLLPAVPAAAGGGESLLRCLHHRPCPPGYRVDA